jgi:hypothetical protein
MADCGLALGVPYNREVTLEAFARLVPESLLDCSGEVFYSGRAAFSGSRPVYLLGYNPGSDPSGNRSTVRGSIEEACSRKADRFSLYYQDWGPGRRKDMQRSIKHFFLDSGLCANLTPSSNCVFVRSPSVRAIPAAKRRQLEDECWRFHKAVIEQLGVKAILCMGNDAFKAVQRRFRVTGPPDEQPWSATQAHRAYPTASGMYLCQLIHPSYGHWQCPKYNPAPLVRRALELHT